MNKQHQISRRSFLKKTSALTAGAVAFPYIVPSSAMGNDGTIAPSNRIVMGAIGYGWQGGNNTKDLLRKKEVQYVAVCDVDKNHLEQAKTVVNKTYKNKDCATYSDFRELLARKDLDAVNIALPDHWHSIPAIMAAKAGLHIHGEKPLSHTLSEGRAICDAVKRYGVTWQTGSWQRSVGNFHRACELVRNGRIGKVAYVEVGLGSGHSDYEKTRDKQAPESPPAELDYDFWVGPAPWAPYCPARVHKNWRWVMDNGGGRLMDWIGHHVDIAHWGLGYDRTGPFEVDGWGKYPTEGVWDSPTEYEFRCKYFTEVEIVVSSSFEGGAKWFGPDGWIFVGRGQIDAEPKSLLKEVIGPRETRLYKSNDHMQNFLDCIKSQKQTITPCETAHRSASVGHLGVISMYLGRKLRFNPVTERIDGDETANSMLSKSFRSPWRL